MNLKHIQKKGEDDKYFHLHDTKTKSDFKVAKKGLSPLLHGQIAQHFAQGGEAAVDPADAELNSVENWMQDKPKPQQFSDGGEYGGAGVDNSSDWSVGGAMDWVGNKLSSQNPDDARMAASQAQLAQKSTPQRVDPAMAIMGATMTPPLAAAQQDTPAVAEAAAEGKPAAVAASQPEPSQATMQPAAKPQSFGVNANADDKALNASFNAEAKAAQDKADLEQRRYEAIANDRAASNQNIQKIQAQCMEDYQNTVRQQDEAAKAFRDQKIDPSAYWTNKSTAGKIGSIAAILLGGLGSGLSGGPNVALQMLNQEAERDVDAQKEALGQKKTYYSMMIDKGHSVQEATKLALANQQSVIEGQLQATADKYSGLETQPQAQAVIAQLQQQRIQRTQEAHSSRIKNALESEDLKSKQIQNALQGNQLALAPLQREIQMRTALGQGVDPRLAPFMDSKTTVKLDDGKLYSANDEKDAAEMKDAQEASKKVIDTANAIKLYRKQNSGGVLLNGARGKELQDELETNLAELSTKARLNASTKNDLGQFITNPSDKTTTDARVAQQMDALIDRSNRHVAAAIRARLKNAAGGSGSAKSLTVKRADD